MMKRLNVLAVAVAISLSLVSSGFAAEGYGSAGCGLGSLIFGNEPGFVQVFAATTNGTFQSQTFGITSGTSNCEKQAKFAGNEKMKEFVVANLDNLAKDIAMGRGESLDTLSELMGISAEKKAEVHAKMQSNFSNIFTSERVEAADVIDSIAIIVNG